MNNLFNQTGQTLMSRTDGSGHLDYYSMIRLQSNPRRGSWRMFGGHSIGGGRRPTVINLSRLITKCRNMRQLKQIHAHIITSSSTATLLLNRILFFTTTSELGSIPYATTLFHTIQNPNLFMFNTMIRAHVTTPDHHCPNGSLGFYKSMLCHGISPDHITFPFLLKYCSLQRSPVSGQSVHAHVIKMGVEADVFVQNGLISMYASIGLVQCAMKVFDGMKNRDVVSWNSILIGCLRCGELDAALHLFDNMKERNIFSWNSIVTGLVQGGRPKDALRYFHEMLGSKDGGARPDKITVAGVISACAALGALDQGRWIHSYLKRSGLEFDTVIGTALIDMYGKCGCVERATDVFDMMHEKDVLTWTAMTSAFAVNGHGEEAFVLLPEMEKHGLKPNYVTFGALLSGCAHSGLLIKGKQCFDMMREVYSIQPNAQHYACMVDLLGRAGLFEEALQLIRSMPMVPDVYVLGALVGGCRMHGNAELGEELAKYLIDLDPNNHVFYVILSDIYAKAGRFNEVKRIREFMSENGIKKTLPGCSTIEVDGMVYEFSVNGAVDVSLEEIVMMLKMLVEELKYVDDAPRKESQEYASLTVI